MDRQASGKTNETNGKKFGGDVHNAAPKDTIPSKKSEEETVAAEIEPEKVEKDSKKRKSEIEDDSSSSSAHSYKGKGKGRRQVKKANTSNSNNSDEEFELIAISDEEMKSLSNTNVIPRTKRKAALQAVKINRIEISQNAYDSEEDDEDDVNGTKKPFAESEEEAEF
mmetsp:Transcript_6857/g.10294  ORF Transcript_6857/g.10294 Transcript_6857/m.10294 type:complete len:167 (+) Transcript_6857:237-737(+)